jgi:nucleoside-diphosphate-sugar epimerase
MKVLITGASGFVGGALADGLYRNHGCEVVALSRNPDSNVHSDGIHRVIHDLTKPLLLDGSIDYIVHCANVQNFRQMSSRDFIGVNLEMTKNIAEYGKNAGVKGIIFASSIGLHGEIREGVVDEHTDRINPSLYGISKFLCEQLLREYQEFFPEVALRLCGVVGRGDASCWPARVLIKARRGERIDIINAHRKFNNIVHTDDLTSLIHALMSRGFSGFNAFPLASLLPMSIRDVVSEIITAAGSRSEICDRGVTRNSFIISNDCAMSRFGYAPNSVIMNLRKYVSENAVSSPGCWDGAYS